MALHFMIAVIAMLAPIALAVWMTGSPKPIHYGMDGLVLGGIVVVPRNDRSHAFKMMKK